ncbi:MAG: T9SS type A sorting domain-containing protein [Chitinophagaceae bacterium]
MKATITFFIATFFCIATQAQSTWTGSVSNDWFTSGNWSPTGVPLNTVSVIIPSTLSGSNPYPTLTGNVVVAGITMNSGAIIHLGGKALVDSGTANISGATVDGGGSFSIINAGTALAVSTSSFTTALSILNYHSSAGIFDNTIIGDVIISDSSTQGTGANYIDGNTITGNFTLTHASATDEMDEGRFSPSGNGNDITGNATFNQTGGGAFYSSYAHPLIVSGNLTINRTASGYTGIFNVAGATSGVGGNFSFNSTGGTAYFNQANTNTVLINGKVNMSMPSIGDVRVYGMKNLTAGGSVSIAGSNYQYFYRDTLKAPVSITAYTGQSYIYDNSITGDFTVSDVSGQNTGANYIDGNYIDGNFTLTHASATDEMDEGRFSPSGNGNDIIGNATFNQTGGGAFYSSYAHPLIVSGNLTINRTASGYTGAFNIPGLTSGVGGNFTFNSTGGTAYFNQANTNTVLINGTVNMSMPSIGDVRVYGMKNLTAGGTINIAGSNYQAFLRDSLKATVSITGYTNQSYIYDNSITGDFTVADASTQNTDANYIDGNLVTGNFTLTHASTTNQIDEGYGSPTSNGNHIMGNATYNQTGAGTFISCYSHPLRVNGNFSVIRTAAGYTGLFNVAGTTSSVGGDFTFNSAGGTAYFNNSNIDIVLITGKVNMAMPSIGDVRVYGLKNLTAGGTITIAGSTYQELYRDTMKATVSITGYTGQSFIYDNSITGDFTVSDASTQNTGLNYIDGNMITGNLNITHASATDGMDEGYGSPHSLNNYVTGNAIFNLTGAGSFSSSYSRGIMVGGNFIINRTAAGATYLFNNPTTTASVGGDFLYTTVGGSSRLNASNSIVVPVAGKFGIHATTPTEFLMYKMKNAVAGDSVIISAASGNVNASNDTLKSVFIDTGYSSSSALYDNSITGNMYVSDAPSQGTGANSIDGNFINGSLWLTHASGTDVMYEGSGSPSNNANYVVGSTTINLTGAGAFVSSYSHGLHVGNNLMVTRTIAGNTTLFNSPTTTAIVGGDFTYTTAGGYTNINPGNGTQVTVGGKLKVEAFTAGDFRMYKMKNAVAGDSVIIGGATYFDMRNDTLKAVFIDTGYKSTSFIYDNSILGNATIVDAAAQNTGSNYVDGNLISGSLLLVHNSNTDFMYEGLGSPSNSWNHVTGDAAIYQNGGGSFVSSYSHGLQVGGNLSFTKISAANTTLFNTPGGTAAVGGNFSYIVAGGQSYINPSNGSQVVIGGTIKVRANPGGDFRMYKIKNIIAGDTIVLNSTNYTGLVNDTLKAVLIDTAYTNQSSIYDNSITGNTLIADAASQNSSGNDIDGNLFNGNFTLVHKSLTDVMYDGLGGPSGNANRVKGIDSLVKEPGANTFYLSYSHIHSADSDFILNATSGSGIFLNSLNLGGSTNGQIRQAGTQPLSFPLIYLNKTGNAKAILDSGLIVTNTLTFGTGYIIATNSHPLIFASGSAASGASDVSHVLGTVLKVGSTAFTFPTGQGEHLSPAGISAPGVATDTFSAAYIPHPGYIDSYDSSLKDASIHHISRREYWIIDRAASSTSTVKVTLGFVRANSGIIRSMPDLTVAHWYGSPAKWHDEGNGATTGTNTLGTITSNNTISTFSPFTIASTTAANSLPIHLTRFDVQKVDKAALLTWQNDDETGLNSYQVEHSSDGIAFAESGNPQLAKGSGSSTYTQWDEQPSPSMNFYRLRMTTQDARISYSAIRTLDFGIDGQEIQVYPNPVKGRLFINAQGSYNQVIVRNVAGSIVVLQKLNGSGMFSLDLSTLIPGIYSLEVNGEAGIIRKLISKE